MTPKISRTVTHDAPSTRRTSRWGRGLRAALLVLVVAAGCHVAHGFGRLWAEWRHVSEAPQAAAAVPLDTNLLAPVLPVAGPWSFANLDWNVRSQHVNHGDVKLRLESLAALSSGSSDEQLPDISPDLVELAEKMQMKPVERNGNLVYRAERPDMIGQMVVRTVAGKSKAVSIAMAFPISAVQWQLFELTPGAASGNFNASDEHLLPLPEAAHRSGGRFADDGRPLLELISVNAMSHDLLSMWKNAGWEVRPSGMGGPQDFSYLCVRGDEVVYAWSAEPIGSLRNVMLVRTPMSSDTGRVGE